MTQALRQSIRSGEIECPCWGDGSKRGFKLVGGVTAYDGTEPQGHGAGCPWLAAVTKVYEIERAIRYLECAEWD